MLLAALVLKDLVPVVSVLMMGMSVYLVNLKTVETEDLRFLCIHIIYSLKVPPQKKQQSDKTNLSPLYLHRLAHSQP